MNTTMKTPVCIHRIWFGDPCKDCDRVTTPQEIREENKRFNKIQGSLNSHTSKIGKLQDKVASLKVDVAKLEEEKSDRFATVQRLEQHIININDTILKMRSHDIEEAVKKHISSQISSLKQIFVLKKIKEKLK